MRIAGALAVIVPVAATMVIPAQAVDFSSSAQSLNMRVIILFLADDGRDPPVISVTADLAGHFVSVVVGMVVIVLVGMVVIMLVSVVVIMFIAVVVIMFIAVVVIMFIAVVVIMFIAVVVIMFISVVVIMFISVVVIMFISVIVIMLVSVVVIMLVSVIVIIGMIIMCRAGANGDNSYTSRGIDDIAAFARALHRLQQVLFPTRAVNQDQIGFGDRRKITRRGNECMLIGADRYQRADLGVVASHISRHISENAVRRHNMQLTTVGE